MQKSEKYFMEICLENPFLPISLVRLVAKS